MNAPEPTCPEAAAGSSVGLRPGDVTPVNPSMPVELWFGEHHIGVKSNTPTCIAFQRFANQILADFRAAKTAVR